MNTENSKKDLSCWVLSEGIAGTENQCIAVAESLGVSFEVKRILLKQPWKSLSPYLGLECAGSFSPALVAPWPDLLIAAGRKSIAASRYIKKASGGKTFTVQIQDPRISPKHFDLLAVPAHDPLRGDNVITTQASPNRITAEKLEAARKDFPQFDAIKSPRVAVLIGGSSKAYTMTADIMRQLAGQLSSLDAGLMITTSRRTGEENEEILRDALKDSDAYIWGGSDSNGGENPYFGMLAYADYILVTADSASMLSDACSTGKPAYMIEMHGGHARIDKLHQNLQNIGALRIFDGAIEPPCDYETLNDAQMVAQAIKEKMNLK